MSTPQPTHLIAIRICKCEGSPLVVYAASSAESDTFTSPTPARGPFNACSTFLKWPRQGAAETFNSSCNLSLA